MNLKELYHLRNSLIDLWDFASNHLDGDKTNLTNEMHEHCSKSLDIVKKQLDKTHLRNAIAKIKRERAKTQNKK